MNIFSRSLRRQLTTTCLVALPWAASALAAGAATGPAQSMAQVSAVAVQSLRQHYLAPGSRVVVGADPFNLRMRLAACPTALQATVPQQPAPTSMVTVQVRCAQPGGWIVRIPLRLQLFRHVLVTVRPLQRGDGIRPGDVRAEERDVTRLGYGYIDSLDQVAGRTLARPLVSGSVLTPAAMGGRRMVQAGDHVQLVAQIGDIEVRATGIALGGGDNGARLRVKNDSSGRVIDALVTAPGVVRALP
ncbi:MAG: flagellar basal body P-ring formation protein FlgA [Pseudomonadota bacterium]|nr:flagellar basal body P-ring formation protein FlgA [Pseudomonadota bacterium]